MIRILIALVLVAALAFLAVWLVEHPGGVDVAWGDWRIQTSVPVAILAVVVLVGGALLLYRLLAWIINGPKRLGDYMRGNRNEKGYRALTEGMAAIASGDWRSAQKSADRAEKYLAAPPMSRLLKAQAAQLAGDDAAAETHFRAMLDTPETELVAVRGLLIQAGQTGDHEKAVELAKRAHRLQPEAGWAIRALFDLQTAGRDWIEAVQTLIAGIRVGAWDKARGAHLRAVLEIAVAEDEERAGKLGPAVTHAQAALKHDPDHVPAILSEARLQHAAGRARRARKHLAEAWERLRHPDIARAMLELQSDGDAEARLKAFEKSNAANMDDAETQLVLGRLALDAGNAELARDYGLAAADRADLVDQRYCRLLVDAFERLDDGAEPAREWLVRLADAPLPPRWQCSHCHTAAPGWTPNCPACEQFDGLEWREAELAIEPILLVESTEDAQPVEDAPEVPTGTERAGAA